MNPDDRQSVPKPFRHISFLSALSALLMTFLASACGPSQETENLPDPVEDEPVVDQMVAVIHPTQGNEVEGVVTFLPEGDGVRVTATISGLEPESMHGIHIHEYGDCTAADATSAGGHYNPYGMPHGAPTDAERHMGDLGNLTTDSEGNATMEYVDETIETSGAFSILGHAMIVHSGQDDYTTQPTGDAGARLGCGVIGVAQVTN